MSISRYLHENGITSGAFTEHLRSISMKTSRWLSGDYTIGRPMEQYQNQSQPNTRYE